MQATGFRYAADASIHPDLVGKSAADTARDYAQLKAANDALMARFYNPSAAAPAPNPAMTPRYNAPSNTPAPFTAPTDDEFLTNPAAATKQWTSYIAQTQFNPVLNSLAATAAQQSKTLVAMQRPDDFKRWGPEIEATLLKVAPDPALWTTENINYVTDMVRGRHVDDLLVEERAKHQNPLGGASLRPDGSPGVAPSANALGAVDLDKMPPNYSAALQAMKVDGRMIDSFLISNYVKSGLEPTLDKARERWIAQVQRGDVITDGHELISQVNP